MSMPHPLAPTNSNSWTILAGIGYAFRGTDAAKPNICSFYHYGAEAVNAERLEEQL